MLSNGNLLKSVYTDINIIHIVLFTKHVSLHLKKKSLDTT